MFHLSIFHKSMFHKLSRPFMMGALIVSLWLSQGLAASAQPISAEEPATSTNVYLPLVIGGSQAGQPTETMPLANEATSVSAATGTPTKTLPSILYLSLKAPVFNLPGLPGKVGENDIARCVRKDNTCIWSMYLKGSDLGLAGANLLDFEVLANGDMLFVIDRDQALPGLGAVTPRDVIRRSSNSKFSLELVGANVGLTNGDENIDAVAIDPTNNYLVISTIGSAMLNGVGTVRNSDLVEINGAKTAGSLYFDSAAVGLTSSDEDVVGIWIGTPSPDTNLYLVTKGSFSAKSLNSLSGENRDVFGCAPATLPPLAKCFFVKLFDKSFDNQIDGFSFAR